MKHLSILFIIALFFITSCQKSGVAPATQRKSIASSELQGASANATTTYDNHVDLDLAAVGVPQANPCGAELLQIVSGIYHSDLHLVINGKKISVTQHGSSSDYKLVGLTSGRTYTASVINNEHQDISLTNGSTTLVITESAVLTTPGGNNNSIEKFDLHETFDANGNVTVTVDNFRAVCK